MLVLRCQLAPAFVNNTTPEFLFVAEPFPFHLRFLQTIILFVSELRIQSIIFAKVHLNWGK